MVVVHDNSKTVNTIQDRDNITVKFNNMEVTVLDASADSIAKEGKAVYRYISSTQSWILQSIPTTTLTSNDSSLDTLQEIVDYIKGIKSEVNVLYAGSEIGQY